MCPRRELTAASAPDDVNPWMRISGKLAMRVSYARINAKTGRLAELWVPEKLTRRVAHRMFWPSTGTHCY